MSETIEKPDAASTIEANQSRLKDTQAIEAVQPEPIAAPETPEEKIYDGAPSESEDDVWLAHGGKMLDDSVPGVRSAASELIKALGLLQSVYLGILGFAKFIPENLDVWKKAFFIIPIIPWVVATYFCLRVMKTEILDINLRSPSDIRDKATKLLQEKQSYLELAFVFFVVGIILTFLTIIFRLQI